VKRPDHPDFWLISQVLIDNDKASEMGGLDGIVDQVARYVDPASIDYAARVQVTLLLDHVGRRPLYTATEVTIMLQGLFQTAFVHGAAFQSLKQHERERDVHYTSVNEEGEVYDHHASVDAALAMLREFPNDTVVISLHKPYEPYEPQPNPEEDL
jgi:hypothetical protein